MLRIQPLNLTGCKSRIKNVNVDADVDVGVAHALLKQLDDTVGANLVQVSRSNDLEAAPLVVLDIAVLAEERGTDPRVDGRVANQPFLVGEV